MKKDKTLAANISDRLNYLVLSYLVYYCQVDSCGSIASQGVSL